MWTSLKRYRFGKPRGFTLVELLVVLAIMVVITGALLLRQSKFDSSTLLRSLTYSVALSVRQAQIYGTSVFGTTTASGVVFAPGYGIYISWGSGNPTTYTLFADFDNNGTYTDNTETVKVFTLNNGFNISNICATTGGLTPATYGAAISGNCTVSGITWMSIIYRRPNPEACFATNLAPTACALNTAATYSSGNIQVQASTADANSTRSIFMNTTGQISVNTAIGS